MTGRWPKLDYAADKAVIESFHAYAQVIGKLPTRAKPWLNHSWHVAWRVVPEGLRTYPVEIEGGSAEVLVNCANSHVEIITSTGERAAISMAGRTVADFHAAFSRELRAAGIATSVSGIPNEVEEAVPFTEDKREHPWDGETVRRMHEALIRIDRVFNRFRTGFVGKSSPSHFFWGSFDHAVTRFSGREAPLHPGGFPNLPDRVTREAYSHEVASAGFWFGGGGVDEAAFYVYGYPTPDGLADTELKTDGAYWHEDLGEFVLLYEKVREDADPDAVLMAFLEETYAAIADRGDWDREALEIPRGSFGEPYDVDRQRDR